MVADEAPPSLSLSCEDISSPIPFFADVPIATLQRWTEGSTPGLDAWLNSGMLTRQQRVAEPLQSGGQNLRPAGQIARSLPSIDICALYSPCLTLRIVTKSQLRCSGFRSRECSTRRRTVDAAASYQNDPAFATPPTTLAFTATSAKPRHMTLNPSTSTSLSSLRDPWEA